MPTDRFTGVAIATLSGELLGTVLLRADKKSDEQLFLMSVLKCRYAFRMENTLNYKEELLYKLS